MFNRSQHLHGMGIENASPDAEVERTNLKAPTIIEQDLESAEMRRLKNDVSVPCDSTSVTSKSREKSTSDDSGMEDTDWTKFKMDFSAKLQNLENKISSEQPPGDNHVTSTSSNLRQQLLINAITSLHSSRQGQQTVEENEPSSELCGQSQNDTDIHIGVSKDDNAGGGRDGDRIGQQEQALVSLSRHTESKNDINTNLGKKADEGQDMTSPSNQNSLLSLEAFDSIHEASLDNALRNIDATQTTTRTTCSRDDSDLDLSGKGPPPPKPKLAWSTPQEDGGNETLMKELEQLSLAQRSNAINGTSTAFSKPTTSGLSKGMEFVICTRLSDMFLRTKELINLPPLVLKARHLSGSSFCSLIDWKCPIVHSVDSHSF